VKIGDVVFKICEQTDKQTDRQTLIAILLTPIGERRGKGIIS